MKNRKSYEQIVLISLFEKVAFCVRASIEIGIFAFWKHEHKHNLILTKLLTLIHYL